VLTRAGKAKLAELDGKSNDGAESWLAPLSAANQARLQAAMAEVERLLKASEIVVRLEDPGSAVATWCLEQFFRELGGRFEGGFDPDRTKPAGAEEMTPPRGCFLVATLPDQPVGCGGLKLDPKSGIGEIKRMWVSPDVRGLGVGRRLLDALEGRARESGVELLRLETNRSLVEAQALYRTSGYTETRLFDDEPYAHLAFEKRLR
jgi:ribosomal protein S18 acetylase RimI-like enzyme